MAEESGVYDTSYMGGGGGFLVGYYDRKTGKLVEYDKPWSPADGPESDPRRHNQP